jgi:hypothetical protein
VFGAVGQPAVQVLLGRVPTRAVEDRAQVLGGDPGQSDLLVDIADGKCGQDPVPAVFGALLR